MRLHHLSVQRLLIIIFLCFASQVSAGRLVGTDIPASWYVDQSAAMTLEDFLALPDAGLSGHDSVRAIGYTRAALWVRFSLPPAEFNGSERWLRLGPNYLDKLTLFFRHSGSAGPWTEREAGDLHTGQRGDIRYRFPVFILPPPGRAGYDVVIRVESTSAVLLDAALWPAEEFVQHAASETSFWSFYLGLGVFSSLLALVLALLLKRRLLWSVFVFSLSFLLVASVQGYPAWLLGDDRWHLQHYLTGISTLLTYSALLWVCAGVLDLRHSLPLVHKIVLGSSVLIALQLFSIPFDFYATAIGLAGLTAVAAVFIFAAGAVFLWWRQGFSLVNLLFGLAPLFYVGAGILALMSLYGMIPYYDGIYSIWQYMLLLNMLLVMLLALRRIREEHLAQQEKEQLVRDLRIEREASFNQRQFIGMVSHEFRTPLAVISAVLENLHLGGSEQQRQQRYQKIQRATDRLVVLTDNCLADARLSADSLYIDLQPTDLLELIRSAAMVVDISDRHAWVLTLDHRPLSEDDSRQLLTVADGGLLRIALSNILDNAVKYSAGGKIRVDVSCWPGEYSITVTDEGPGIPAALAEKIFDRYSRGDVADKAAQRGTGLGLYVARQIARAHGGEVRLMTEYSQGCCFEVIIPSAHEFT